MHPPEPVPGSRTKRILESDTAPAQAHAVEVTQTPPEGYLAIGTNGDLAGELPKPRDIRVVFLGTDTIAQTPEGRNSRVRYQRPALEELAASIRQHGVLQPLLVRPIVRKQTPNGTDPNTEASQPVYVVVAGNRRLRAARLAGLESVPCIIRVTDPDEAFILNVVENLQRRQLSGRERVRALVLLGGLTDESGRTFGVREISRRTGLATGTISTWLRIHHRPMLEEALDDERVDIGRAMTLVSAPDEYLPDLIERARSLSQQDLATEVAAVKGAGGVRVDVEIPADERHALAAYQALLLVERAPDTVRRLLVCVQQRVNELMAL
jgi:ParB/RepB/Spo0J family partition protein